MKIEDYNKYYIQGSDHYLIPKDVFDELFNEMFNWREETKELNKRLEEKENIACNWKDSCLENAGKIEELENQQKEFIKYLEEEISKWHYNYDSNTYEYELEEPPVEELLVSALSKYQEIIGGNKDEK